MRKHSNYNDEHQKSKLVETAFRVGDVASQSATLAACGAVAGLMITPLGVGLGSISGAAIGVVYSLAIGKSPNKKSRHSDKLKYPHQEVHQDLEKSDILEETSRPLSKDPRKHFLFICISAYLRFFKESPDADAGFFDIQDILFRSWDICLDVIQSHPKIPINVLEQGFTALLNGQDIKQTLVERGIALDTALTLDKLISRLYNRPLI